MHSHGFIFLLSAAMAIPASSASALNEAVDRLISEASRLIQKNDWTSVPLQPFQLDTVVMVKGMPTQAIFKAQSGTAKDLSQVRRNGDIRVATSPAGVHSLVVPLSFGQLRINYQQYSFKFSLPTYVGGFTTTFNNAFGEAALQVTKGGSCQVGVSGASLDTFGGISTDIKSPPELVGQLPKVENAVAARFMQALETFSDRLKKALKEASVVDLCNFM